MDDQSELNTKSYFNKPSRESVISSAADTLGKRRLSADPRQEKGNTPVNINDFLGNYQENGVISSKQGSNSRFVDQASVYSSL